MIKLNQEAVVQRAIQRAWDAPADPLDVRRRIAADYQTGLYREDAPELLFPIRDGMLPPAMFEPAAAAELHDRLQLWRRCSMVGRTVLRWYSQTAPYEAHKIMSTIPSARVTVLTVDKVQRADRTFPAKHSWLAGNPDDGRSRLALELLTDLSECSISWNPPQFPRPEQATTLTYTANLGVLHERAGWRLNQRRQLPDGRVTSRCNSLEMGPSDLSEFRRVLAAVSDPALRRTE